MPPPAIYWEHKLVHTIERRNRLTVIWHLLTIHIVFV